MCFAFSAVCTVAADQSPQRLAYRAVRAPRTGYTFAVTHTTHTPSTIDSTLVEPLSTTVIAGSRVMLHAGLSSSMPNTAAFATPIGVLAHVDSLTLHVLQKKQNVSVIDTIVLLPPSAAIDVHTTMSSSGSAKTTSLRSSRTISDELTPVAAALQQIAHLWIELPVNEITPGGSWTTTAIDSFPFLDFSGIVVTNASMLFTYRGIVDTLDRRCWHIVGTSGALTVGPTQYTGEATIEVAGSGTRSMQVWLEEQTGMLVAATVNQFLQLSVQSALALGVTVPVTVHSTMALSRGAIK
jgi:hypothetical protein